MTDNTRPLSAIARDIRTAWPNMNVYARSYVDALSTANRITDRYVVGTHESTVRGFLDNSAGWRGDTAKAVKAELRAML